MAYSDKVLDHYTDKTPNYFFPKITVEGEKVVMLYPGDAGYELEDPAKDSAKHRCFHTPDGWQYINEIGLVL